jgi:hypothetical protein
MRGIDFREGVVGKPGQILGIAQVIDDRRRYRVQDFPTLGFLDSSYMQSSGHALLLSLMNYDSEFSSSLKGVLKIARLSHEIPETFYRQSASIKTGATPSG